MAWENPVTTWGQAGKTVPIADDFNRIEGNIQHLQDTKETPAGAQAKAEAAAGAVQAELNTHKADNTAHVPHLGTTTNSDNNYSITSTKVINDGAKFSVKFNVAATGAATLKISSDGTARALKKPGDGDFKPKAGIYTLIRDGSNFQLLGEGGEYGTATASDVLQGKTIGTENGLVTGTMPNRGAVSNTITTQGGQYTIPSGYHNGSGKVTASFSNLSAGNIKSGVNIGGVIGNVMPAPSVAGANIVSGLELPNYPYRIISDDTTAETSSQTMSFTYVYTQVKLNSSSSRVWSISCTAPIGIKHSGTYINLAADQTYNRGGQSNSGAYYIQIYNPMRGTITINNGASQSQGVQVWKFII